MRVWVSYRGVSTIFTERFHRYKTALFFVLQVLKKLLLKAANSSVREREVEEIVWVERVR